MVGEAPSAFAFATMMDPKLSCTPPLKVFGALSVTVPLPSLMRPAGLSVPPIGFFSVLGVVTALIAVMGADWTADLFATRKGAA